MINLSNPVGNWEKIEVAQSDFIYPAERQVFPTTNGFFVKAVSKFEGYVTKCRRVGVGTIVSVPTSVICVSNILAATP